MVREFLAMLYGRWYQAADEYFVVDAFNLDPQGERFVPWGLREFIRQFGSSDWLTDEWIYALLQLQRDDFLQLLECESLHAEDVLSLATLKILAGEEEEERVLPDDLFGKAMLSVSQHRVVFQYYSLPSYLAVMLTAYRGCQIQRREGWYVYRDYLPPAERLWAAALCRRGLDEAQCSREEVSLPPYPIYPALQDMWEADVLLVWRGWEVGLPGCGLKLVDTVVEVLERLAAASPHRPSAPLEYKRPSFSFSSLYSWLQAGGDG